jgi:glycogen(starch) synthase
MPPPPSFSIVINTDDRAESLARTLQSLRYLDYPDFEVCVVRGPTPDGTAEVLQPWQGTIKVAHCPVRNLAVSRNIGVALSAGDIVAFIDDDAVPEAEWLRDLAAAYETPGTDAAGGFVLDHTGVAFQWKYGTTDRLGETKLDGNRAAPELNLPGSPNFPSLLGTNCSFRRHILLELGGFDEEYEYYLEETDLCCRLIDRGRRIAQVAGAHVHHQLAPGGRRTEQRRPRHWYPTIKNRIYFSLMNGGGHHDMAAIVRDVTAIVGLYRGMLEHDIANGAQTEADLARFHAEVAQAWGDGLTHGLAGKRRLLRPETLGAFAAPFLPFGAPVPEGGRKTFCFLTQHYPPAPIGGVARSVQNLAQAIADLGHHAHVLTRGSEHDRVEFDGGIWVHRVVPRASKPPATLRPLSVPRVLWKHAAAMLSEVRRIAARRPIECVYAPLWDCEGVAILVDGGLPLAVELHTPLQEVMSAQPSLRSDDAYMSRFGRPVIALEKRMLSEATGLRALSGAILHQIEADYGVDLRSRARLIPHGAADWRTRPFVAAPELPANARRLLFVGRLERRKGIDVLLDVAGRLLIRFPELFLDIVGDDTLCGPDGATYRARFEADPKHADVRDRVRFHGDVSDEALCGFYRACDVFVAPSRFESFGLILLEAMMFEKPVVCCRAGGMPEVVAEGETALLAEPGDAASLERCLIRLIDDGALRERLGTAGRRRYEACFTPERMARDMVAFLCDIAATHRAGSPARRAAAE